MKCPSDRFLCKIHKIKNGCWEWTACKNRDGYGHFKLNNKIISAHRFSWILHYGEIYGNLCVLHKCYNPCCVNPEHLFLGTQSDNAIDKYNKGRAADNLHCPPENKARGERMGLSKLKDDDIINILKRHILGEKQIKIAKSYNVTPSNICAIIKRRTWRHINA